MKIFKKTVLVAVVLTGILLFPLVAEFGANLTNTIATPSAYGQEYPSFFPAGGTFWHKWSRWGSYWEKGEGYGQWNNWNNRWNTDYNYNRPYDNGYPGGVCRAPSTHRVSPYISYARRHAGIPDGYSGNYRGGGPGGFNQSPYWRYATNDGRGAWKGPPLIDYSKYGHHDNPPTKEELNKFGNDDVKLDNYASFGHHDNPPTREELNKFGSNDSQFFEFSRFGYSDINDLIENQNFGNRSD